MLLFHKTPASPSESALWFDLASLSPSFCPNGVCKVLNCRIPSSCGFPFFLHSTNVVLTMAHAFCRPPWVHSIRQPTPFTAMIIVFEPRAQCLLTPLKTASKCAFHNPSFYSLLDRPRWSYSEDFARIELSGLLAFSPFPTFPWGTPTSPRTLFVCIL